MFPSWAQATACHRTQRFFPSAQLFRPRQGGGSRGWAGDPRSSPPMVRRLRDHPRKKPNWTLILKVRMILSLAVAETSTDVYTMATCWHGGAMQARASDETKSVLLLLTSILFVLNATRHGRRPRPPARSPKAPCNQNPQDLSQANPPAPKQRTTVAIPSHCAGICDC